MTILSDSDTPEEVSSLVELEEDPALGLEGLDLSDYLRERAEIDAYDAGLLILPFVILGLLLLLVPLL